MAAVRELLLAHTRITLVQAEPIDHVREALYASVNSRGVLVSGFGGAIRLVGGGEIERELRSQGPLLVGGAYATQPGLLANRGVARVIFGVVAHEPGDAPRRDFAERALTAGLELVGRERLRSLTLPEVAVRVSGISLGDAGRLLIDGLGARLRRGSMLDDVVIAGLHLEYLRGCRDALLEMGATNP